MNENDCKFCKIEKTPAVAHHCYEEYVIRLAVLQRKAEHVIRLKRDADLLNQAEAITLAPLFDAIEGMTTGFGDAAAQEVMERFKWASIVADAALLVNASEDDMHVVMLSEALIQWAKYRHGADTLQVSNGKPLSPILEKAKELLDSAGEGRHFAPPQAVAMLKECRTRLAELVEVTVEMERRFLAPDITDHLVPVNMVDDIILPGEFGEEPTPGYGTLLFTRDEPSDTDEFVDLTSPGEPG